MPIAFVFFVIVNVPKKKQNLANKFALQRLTQIIFGDIFKENMGHYVYIIIIGYYTVIEIPLPDTNAEDSHTYISGRANGWYSINAQI